MYEEVSEIYGMDSSTYRIVIGKSYALFFRIDQEKKEILVGRIFQSKQMNREAFGGMASRGKGFFLIYGVTGTTEQKIVVSFGNG